MELKPTSDNVLEMQISGKSICQIIGAILLTLGLLRTVKAAWGVVFRRAALGIANPTNLADG